MRSLPVIPLSKLVGGFQMTPTPRDVDPLVRGVAYDSRLVEPGDLFVCVRGGKDDGHRYARDAASRGAVAVVVERPVEGLDGVPQVAVAESRHAMGHLAARFYGEPSARLHLTGVTGTEGKTTTAYLLDAILRSAGLRTGMLGTIVNKAVAVAQTMGLDLRTTKAALAAVPRVPGRFEVVANSRGLLVVIDFAHTQAAFGAVLPFLRRLIRGRAITVFGCAGDRDRTKRPIIGHLVARLSDLAIVTTDNPAGEDPGAIAEEILHGAGEVDPRRERHRVVLDRGEAVRQALSLARPGDVVLLAGKGHEDFQLVDGTRVPYSDRETVEDALRTLDGSA